MIVRWIEKTREEEEESIKRRSKEGKDRERR